jgi:hypothetical protein
MSQRECAGFNWPPLSVSAGDPDGVSPEAANWACRGSWSSLERSEPSGLTPVVAMPAVSFQSRALGVDHEAKLLWAVKVSATPREWRIPADSPSSALGVAQLERSATACRSGPPAVERSTRRSLDARSSGPPVGVLGVGHEEKSLPGVRSTKARSAGIDRPDGVRRAFQVSENSVEPSEADLACNLLAKDRDIAALAERSGDEREPIRPEVTLVIERFLDTGIAEGSAGAAPGPDRTIVVPPGEAQRVAPDPDAGEEVALPVLAEVVGSNIDN